MSGKKIQKLINYFDVIGGAQFWLSFLGGAVILDCGCFRILGGDMRPIFRKRLNRRRILLSWRVKNLIDIKTYDCHL